MTQSITSMPDSPRTPAESAAPRMDALARLPVFFSLQGKRAFIAGGNAAAAWKAELLAYEPIVPWATGCALVVFHRSQDEGRLAVSASP